MLQRFAKSPLRSSNLPADSRRLIVDSCSFDPDCELLRIKMMLRKVTEKLFRIVSEHEGMDDPDCSLKLEVLLILNWQEN